MEHLSDWHSFDPNNRSTYPKVNSPIQVKYANGSPAEGACRKFFPLLQLAQRECESLIIGPARDSSGSGVYEAWRRGFSRAVPIEQRFMNPDAAVVFNKAELTKAIHEEADARAGRSNHLCQSFLRDLWNQRLWFPWNLSTTIAGNSLISMLGTLGFRGAIGGSFNVGTEGPRRDRQPITRTCRKLQVRMTTLIL
jgi:hypothetical protein